MKSISFSNKTSNFKLFQCQFAKLATVSYTLNLSTFRS